MPKDQALRQRANKAATRTTLDAEGQAEVEIPPLPSHRRWHKLTLEAWQDAWRSPMASQYLQADREALYEMFVIMDKFWRKPTAVLATQLRLMRQQFGLTPLDRRRLEWSIAQAESAKRHTTAPPVPIESADDPRRFLTVVS